MAAVPLRHLCLLLTAFLHLFASSSSLGVNYGTLGNNLPSPAVVANFIKTKTIFDTVKIFDTNPDILRAFANTGISVTVTVGNGDVPAMADPHFARRWVAANIRPFYPQTKIKYISVGNEIILSQNQGWIKNLVPAMRSLNNALVEAGILDVKATTAHAMNILQGGTLPSLSRFRDEFAQSFFVPLLQYHRQSKSPFMINPYPYFNNITPEKLNYATFKPNPGVYDKHTQKNYTNHFDALMDSTYSAMKAVGYGDVDIVIGETGWPSRGFYPAAIISALYYNENVIRKLVSGEGTPLMPHRRFEAYIFALFNENMKTGPERERNWGLFHPDFTPVYKSGVLRNAQPVPPVRTPAPVAGKKFCVPKAGASDAQLQSNLNYACSQGIDCRPVQPGGACANPNTVRSHAAFAMNSYYQTKRVDFACFFAGTGELTTANPSNGSCRFL